MEFKGDFYRQLLKVVGGGILVINVSGEIVYVNPLAASMLAYTRKGLIGKKMQEIVDPDDKKTTGEIMASLNAGKPFDRQLEKIFLQKTGRKFYALVKVSSVEMDNGMYMSMFINDFEHHHIARTRIERQYKDIIEFAEDLLFTVDPSGNFTYANEVAERITGLSNKEILCCNYLDLVADTHKKEVGEFYQRHFSQKTNNISFVFPIKNASGGVVWLDQKLSAIWNESKFRIIGYSAVARDVTDQYELSAKLKESEERLATIFRNISIPILISDPVTADVVELNGVARNLLGYSKEDSQEMNLSDIYADHDLDYIKKSLQKCVEKGLVEGETRWKTKQGIVLDMTLKNSLLQIDGENRILSACDNITELRNQNLSLKIVEGELGDLNDKLLEEIRLRKKIQLNLVNAEERERKRMARELHDGLGQKLTAVKFTLGAVRRSAKLDDPQLEILSESIKLIEETMGEVREIAQDLVPAVLKDFGLQAAVSKICERAGKFNHFDVHYEAVGEIPPMEEHVETAIYRIAQEIMNNASKYSKADNVQVKLNYFNEEVELYIKDDGVGFDLQADFTGAGLNNMKERCAMIDAKCNISSNLGAGTLTVIKYKNNKR